MSHHYRPKPDGYSPCPPMHYDDDPFDSPYRFTGYVSAPLKPRDFDEMLASLGRVRCEFCNGTTLIADPFDYTRKIDCEHCNGVGSHRINEEEKAA